MRLGLLLSLVLIGCANANERCGNKFLLPWPNAEGRYVFQEIQLNTLSDPYRLSGGAAEIFSENVITNNGFEGAVAEPHFTRSGDVCVPTDPMSSMVTSAYAQMEKLWDFERLLGTEKQIKWPRRVGVDIHLNGKQIDVINNAHYYGEQDAMALVPYERSDLPLSFNLGIVAHEHFHAHFQAVVYNTLNAALQMVITPEKLFLPDYFNFRTKAEDVDGSDPSTPRGRNNMTLRGWNEGLADFFAAVYTKRTDFFAVSLPEYAPQRALDLPLGRLNTPQPGDFYSLGAYLARTLYAVSQLADRPPEAVLKHVLERLPDLPRQMTATYTQTAMSGEDILPMLLSGLPMNKSICAELGKAMVDVKKGISACAR